MTDASKAGGEKSGQQNSEESKPKKAKVPDMDTKKAGVFRGDWGATIAYDKDDKVKTEDQFIYQSLKAANLGHEPGTSLEYWKLVKKGLALDRPECVIKPEPGAKLGRCNLTQGNRLSGANLAGADLSRSQIAGELGSADLTGANLSRASVQGGLTLSRETKLRNANLSGLQAGAGNRLDGEGADLSQANLSEANLYNANLKGAQMEQANLKETDLTGANLEGTHLERANLSHSDLSYANLNSGRLGGVAMGQADLTSADLTDADFTQADLQGATLAGSQLAGANLAGVDLRGANLESAQGADSAHIDGQTNFQSAVCPDGVTVDGTAATTCVGHGF